MVRLLKGYIFLMEFYLNFVKSLLILTYLPHFGAKLLLQIFYRLTGKQYLGPAKQNHYKYAVTFIVLSYFAYEVLYPLWMEEGVQYYDILGVRPGVEINPKELKSNFKKLSLQFHPDKVKGNSDHFMKIRLTYEIVMDHFKRSAFEKFGEFVFSCPTCKTERDYMEHGLTLNVGFYLVLGFFIVFSYFSKTHIYWRLLSSLALVSIELYMVTRAIDPWIDFLPSFSVYQKVAFLRSLYFSGILVVGQLSSLWLNQTKDEEEMDSLLNELDSLTNSSLTQSGNHMNLIIKPFEKNDQLLQRIKKMTEKLGAEMEYFKNKKYCETYNSIRSKLKNEE
jgi:curved DNA-binding protein CbpA